MKIFVAGAIIFTISDYILIFGKVGFEPMGLQGSAIATILQYGFMVIAALFYILFNEKNRKYGVELFSILHAKHEIYRFCTISWPIILDKATIACAYIWLGKMISPLGTEAVAAFSAIKDMERMAFLPAIAFAQIITFLISNDIGANDIKAVKVNIKKLLFSWIHGEWYSSGNGCKTNFLSLFDRQGEFTYLVLQTFPYIAYA
ncbi:hypothetical protein IPH67_05665 [bacterium]|nr:MAG: hypothetical protein IPH67_05665 [bacterium]